MRNYLHNYDVKVGDLLSKKNLNYTELYNELRLSYPNLKKPTFKIHLRNIIGAKLIIKGWRPKPKRTAKYRLTKKGQILHRLGIFTITPLYDATIVRRQKKLVSLLLLFKKPDSPYSNGFTVEEFLNRSKRGFDNNDDNHEQVAGTIPGSGEYVDYGVVELDYDSMEIRDTLDCLEKCRFMVKTQDKKEIRYYVPPSLRKFVWKEWNSNYDILMRRLYDMSFNGRPSYDETEQLAGFFGKNLAQIIISESYAIWEKTRDNDKSKPQESHESVNVINKNELKDIRKMIVRELIRSIFTQKPRYKRKMYTLHSSEPLAQNLF